MQNFQNAVNKALNMFGPDIFINKHVFLNVIEDLVPYLENDYKFVKKVFDSDLGGMLKKAYISTELKNQYYDDIMIYLLNEVGLSEKKAFQFISYFTFVMSAKKQKMNFDTCPDEGMTSKQVSTVFISDEEVWRNIELAVRQGNISEAIRKFDNSQLTYTSNYYNKICLILGKALEDKEPSKAAIYFEKAANNDDARAQFLLAYMYENGEGVVKDINRAMQWYTKAADAGERGALHNLGCFYYFGTAVSQDYDKAFGYFLRAAGMGKADSMKNVGVMYEIGQHVERDYERALFWYNEARNRGDADADSYYRNLEKKVKKQNLGKRVLFRILNTGADKKDLYINVGEEIRGRSFSEYLQVEPILKLLYNDRTKQIGIKNLSSFDWTIVKLNSSNVTCKPNKVIPIEQGDMIRIIHRVVQLNVLKIEKEN